MNSLLLILITNITFTISFIISKNVLLSIGLSFFSLLITNLFYSRTVESFALLFSLFLQKNIKKYFFPNTDSNFYKLFLPIGVFILIEPSLGFEVSMVLSYFISIILFRLPKTLFIVFCFCFFMAMMILLMINNDVLAESMSRIFYYFLCGGFLLYLPEIKTLFNHNE